MNADNFREVIEKIRNSVSIVDVISNYVNLKKTGKSYRGLCPFHVEKTPSFYVDPDKGLFHCFGCGASGNVFTFLMKKEGLTFAEAVRELAKQAGIKIEYETKISKEFLILKETQAYYQRSLHETPEGKVALDYLKTRKVTHEAMLYYGLGYASGAGLVTYLRNKGFDFYTMLKLGILKESVRGGYVEFFNNRLIFPIYDQYGNCVAFGGRALDSSDEPKYINTPETEFFKKGKVLYGFHLAKKEIRDNSKAVIVEGYFDVLALFMLGVKNAVAPMGTALTEDQAALLGSCASKAVLLFDSDEAGQKAVLRSIKVLLEKGILPYVGVLKEVKDAAEAWEKEVASSVFDALDGAISFAQYVMNVSKTIEERASNVRELLESISRIENPVLRKDFNDMVSKAFGIEGMGLSEILKLLSKNSASSKTLNIDFVLSVASLFDDKVREVFVSELEENDLISDSARLIYRNLKDGKTPEEVISESSEADRITDCAINYIGEINDRVREEMIRKIRSFKASLGRKMLLKGRLENRENVEKILVEFFKSKKENLRG
ncbi:MAG: DNA primase [candidate division WOR-3 bacterium]